MLCYLNTSFTEKCEKISVSKETSDILAIGKSILATSKLYQTQQIYHRQNHTYKIHTFQYIYNRNVSIRDVSLRAGDCHVCQVIA